MHYINKNLDLLSNVEIITIWFEVNFFYEKQNLYTCKMQRLYQRSTVHAYVWQVHLNYLLNQPTSFLFVSYILISLETQISVIKASQILQTSTIW